MKPLHNTHHLRWPRIIVLVVLAYEAAGALVGGAFLFTAPDGHLMDMPVEMMHGAFRDFLIPGIILFGMGILSAIVFVVVLRRAEADWYMATIGLSGWIIWFVTEIIIIRELHWLHIMWATPVLLGAVTAIPIFVTRHNSIAVHTGLLYCGIASSAWYLLINVLVPLYYEGYSHVTLTVSELSAIDAPTRILWVLLVPAYPLLFAALGWGIFYLSTQNRALRVVAGLIIAYSIFNFYWPPMHMRGIEPTLTDALHIGWSMVTVILMMLIMGFGAASQGKIFRIYTLVTFVVFVIFGLLIGKEAPGIPENLPTPHIGIWERINIGAFMLWVILFSLTLLRTVKHTGKALNHQLKPAAFPVT